MKNPLFTSLRNFLAEARAELRANGGAPVSLDGRTVGVLVLTCVLLTVFFYYGRPGFFRSHTVEMAIAGALDLDTSVYRGLIPYWGWALASILLRIVIPLACIVWWFRESPRDYGFRMWKKGHGKIYALLYLVMLPVLVAMSFTESFQHKYPFYDNATDSVAHFVLYEVAYGVQFFSLEAFFRGFLIFALFKKFGYYAVVIMTVPYCMIHFSKPVPETLGAIIAGLALGYLAIQSKSWIPGALLHWGVGVTMDLLVVGQKLSSGLF
ncbi:CPBP family intramembrane metalloprotease [Persicimonas caeni]|uniref:CPBP family intramembrane metalloprotease n=1 Tax=Persicimonas caeni TaxID=2292766 RepID=A0A4Y6Q167_PERCE|nr:CPBP family intramembrane glutamic endopeptidase [Persicimonas caeni]QDG54324.1 CPBP family intramembrane metalloprotease [Persicimonas caeni]QED35545.1 CPBP family intramembrane metalloprotease [Persicimonas caeni]